MSIKKALYCTLLFISTSCLSTQIQYKIGESFLTIESSTTDEQNLQTIVDSALLLLNNDKIKYDVTSGLEHKVRNPYSRIADKFHQFELVGGNDGQNTHIPEKVIIAAKVYLEKKPETFKEIIIKLDNKHKFIEGMSYIIAESDDTGIDDLEKNKPTTTRQIIESEKTKQEVSRRIQKPTTDTDVFLKAMTSEGLVDGIDGLGKGFIQYLDEKLDPKEKPKQKTETTDSKHSTDQSLKVNNFKSNSFIGIAIIGISCIVAYYWYTKDQEQLSEHDMETKDEL